MFKKIILIFLLSLPVTAQAGFWQALGACFTDPCNCGDPNPTRWEQWNGENINKGKRNRVCPPWNKTGGRHNNTCLVKAPLPGIFIGYYENLCAEEAPESNYFEPKIRIRGQQCNFAACWTTNNVLAWDGECVTLASGYGIPLHRMCARIAIPADYAENFPQDPGYTPKVHLNFEGATVPDEPIIGYDGQILDFDPPKLCAYYDPAFFSFKDGFDLMDLDPYKQSYHKTDEVHPVIKVIIFFFEISSQTGASAFDMIGSLFGIMAGGDEGGTTFFRVLGDLFNYLGFLIELIGQLIITLLEEIGQINRAVDSTIYGCVEIPMGPYPPPFCPIVANFFETAKTQKICEKASDGTPVPSTEGAECVVSTLTNNFVRNSVRISFENFVPLCKNGEDPLVTDKCVVLDNLGSFSSATGIHTMTAKTDIVPPCTNAPSGALCVKTKIPHECSVSANGCQDGFRLVYGINTGGIAVPQSYFYDDINDCPNTDNIHCQEIWGVNTSEFVDISLSFPTIQNVPDIAPLTTTASLKDKENRTTNFAASIVRVSSFDPILEITQEPTQICVSQGDIVVGCEDRAPFVGPILYDCNNPLAPITCESSYFAPKFVATIKDGTDSTSVLVAPASVYNINSPTEGVIVNLAGYNFDSFVTDDSFAKRPFSGPKSPNPGSLYGNYRNNLSPINNDFSENTDPNVLYLNGIEYINDKYHAGGKYACLEHVDATKCPQNVKNCVLSNLDNTNVISCSTFLEKLSQYPDLNLCNVTQMSVCTTNAEYIPGNNGGYIVIKSCGNEGSEGYCYISSTGDEICKVSYDPAKREIPSASLGATLSDSQYYDIENTSPGYNYDQNLYSLRDKTSYELNLCTEIPRPTCAALDDYSVENGSAAWPETPVGDVAVGTCISSKFAYVPLERVCIPDIENKTFQFEPLYNWFWNGVSWVQIATNVRCQ